MMNGGTSTVTSTRPRLCTAPLVTVFLVFSAFSGVGADVWTPMSTWTHYNTYSGAPRHYASAGCFMNPGGTAAPIMPDGKHTLASMTPAKCMDHCATYQYFGLVGDFCSCGNSVSGLTDGTGTCTTNCAGDAGYPCGGTFAMSVYSVHSCSSQQSCGDGHYQSAKCTTTADRVCTTCETGYYCPGDGLRRACNVSSSCEPGMYETDGCTAPGRAIDRVCSFCGGCAHLTSYIPNTDHHAGWQAYKAAISGLKREPALVAATRAANDKAASCVGDPKYWCPGDGARYIAPAGYYTIIEDGKNVNPYAPAKGPNIGDHNMRTTRVKCGDSKYYCPGDGLRYDVKAGYMTTGAEAGDDLNRTRSGEIPCGGEPFYCQLGVQYWVNRGFYSIGQTPTTRTERVQCGNETYWCPGDGIRHDVSVGYHTISTIMGGNGTTRDEEEPCGASNLYCHGGVRYTAPRGYYTVGGPGMTTWPDNLGPTTERASMWHCGINKYYCPGDGIKYVVPEGQITIGDNDILAQGKNATEAFSGTTYRACAPTCWGYIPCGTCKFYCTKGERFETEKGYYAVGGDNCTNHNARRECGGCIDQPLKGIFYKEGLSEWYCNGDGIRRKVPGSHFSTTDGYIGGKCETRSGYTLSNHWVDCPNGGSGELCKVSTPAEGELDTDVPSVPWWRGREADQNSLSPRETIPGVRVAG